jgi:cytochrome c oxidase subunit 1
MTAHGAGMVGISGLAGAAIMWHYLNQKVALSQQVLYLNYGLFLLGVVLILGGIFWGGYAGGWTFLWPLPAKSMGVWSVHAAASFVLGLILGGVSGLLPGRWDGDHAALWQRLARLGAGPVVDGQDR